MSLEGARYRASLWLRQGEEDLRPALRELRHRLSSRLERRTAEQPFLPPWMLCPRPICLM